MVTNPDWPTPSTWNPMQEWALRERGEREEAESIPDVSEPVTTDEDENLIDTDALPAEVVPVKVRRHDPDAISRAKEKATGIVTMLPVPTGYNPVAPEPVAEPDPEPVVAPEPPVVEPSNRREARRTAFAESKGFTRNKNKLPPSDTTKGRRERYARKKAERLGITFEEALKSVKKRPQMTRAGRKKVEASE